MNGSKGFMASESESVVELTINAIRNGIRDGRFVPGQRLVVADLTSMLGVSAGPVREAIRRLSGENLIDIIPHSGAMVRKLGQRDLAEIYQLREVVEGLAAELAARNIGEGNNRALLEAQFARESDAIEAGGPAFIKHNQVLHSLIFRIAGNARLMAMGEQLIVPVYRFQQLNAASHVHISHAEHAPMIAAILAGDEKRAGDAMRQHIHNSAGVVLALTRPEGSFDSLR
jgi:DNA-binding GntR family transcriptional regulator